MNRNSKQQRCDYGETHTMESWENNKKLRDITENLKLVIKNKGKKGN